MKENDFLRTPDYIIKALGGVFDLDPCAGENTKIGQVNHYDGRGDCGLKLKWFGEIFVNPPFSEKEAWIKKMIDHGSGILILPERGSAPWFGPLALACERYFVLGKKLNFIRGSTSNNVGSVLFPFGKKSIERIINSGLPGHFVSVEWFVSREKNKAYAATKGV